jgi:hypothetical protein
VEALLACSDQRITPTFDLVFRGEDVLPLAPLLALGLAVAVLQAMGVLPAARHAFLPPRHEGGLDQIKRD